MFKFKNRSITIDLNSKTLYLLTTVLIVTSLSAVFYTTRAAFIEPTSPPSSSDQDFAQNILGANNADNDFDSSLVVASSSGSIIERMEYMTETYLAPPTCEECSSIDYSIFKNQIWDDWKASEVSSSGDLATAYAAAQDMNKEESTWTSETDASLGAETIASGEVMLDVRTGLYWSDCYSAAQDGTCDQRTNSFTLDGVVADVDDGLDAEGGQSVDFCEVLSLDADGDTTNETDWYLPSQKELMLAYVNGIANNAPNPAYLYWSSTEYYNNASYAWGVYLYVGYTHYGIKTINYYARCVHR
jgi:hypothetical protein